MFHTDEDVILNEIGTFTGAAISFTARDAEFRVDEQPFPVERDDLRPSSGLASARHGLVRREPAERPVGVERVRADPGHGAERDDDEQGHGPDDHFELGRVVPVGVVGRVRVRRAVAPREQERERDHRAR